MTTIPDAPWIRACEAGGIPRPPRSAALCPDCGTELDDWAYEIDGVWLCEDCFRDWLADYARTNPREAAAALSVRTRYLG